MLQEVISFIFDKAVEDPMAWKVIRLVDKERYRLIDSLTATLPKVVRNNHMFWAKALTARQFLDCFPGDTIWGYYLPTVYSADTIRAFAPSSHRCVFCQLTSCGKHSDEAQSQKRWCDITEMRGVYTWPLSAEKMNQLFDEYRILTREREKRSKEIVPLASANVSASNPARNSVMAQDFVRYVTTHSSEIKWEGIVYWPSFPEEIYEIEPNLVDWASLNWRRNLSSAFMRRNLHRLDPRVIKKQFVSPDFADDYPTMVDWDSVDIWPTNLSEEFIRKNIGKMSQALLMKQHMSEELINDIAEFIDWANIGKCIKFKISAQFYRQHYIRLRNNICYADIKHLSAETIYLAARNR